jgi:hypothetical protein
MIDKRTQCRVIKPAPFDYNDTFVVAVLFSRVSLLYHSITTTRSGSVVQ